MLNSRDINLLRPDVAANCFLWRDRCKTAGLNVLVTNTVRDNEYQAYLYEQGRTRPGGIVTNSKVPTFHSVEAGLAFDFCKNVKGHEYDDTDFFRKAAAIAKEMGFTWGGDWTSFVDRPHLQWDAGKQYKDSDIKARRYPPEMPLWEGDTVTYEQFCEFMAQYEAERDAKPVSNWAKEAWEKSVADGTFDGTRPQAPLTRQEASVLLDRM